MPEFAVCVSDDKVTLSERETGDQWLRNFVGPYKFRNKKNVDGITELTKQK